MASSSETIRELNDRYRQGDLSIPGLLMITVGVRNLVAESAEGDIHDVIAGVQAFDAFDADNDPHGEHDFGAFEVFRQKLFWKFDYYAPDLQHGSENPADINHTIRVLTIMLAEEY